MLQMGYTQIQLSKSCYFLWEIWDMFLGMKFNDTAKDSHGFLRG